MKGLTLIQSRQRAWAESKGFSTVGRTIPDKGEKNYLPCLADNLFEPLSEASLPSYAKGSGHEIEDSEKQRAKMKALHSSSALVVNVFQHWQDNAYPIAYACGLCTPSAAKEQATLQFEKQYKIPRKSTPAHIDIIIEGIQPCVYAIESKFTEPYRGKSAGIKDSYINDTDLWEDLPHLYNLAKEISPVNNKFRHLDAAQLIKHTLGLLHRYGKSGFHLLYLWYGVQGEESDVHKKEIAQFEKIIRQDGINFSHITYQEVIEKLSKEFKKGNEAYVKYLTERYL